MTYKITHDVTPATIKTAAFFASRRSNEIAEASIRRGALWHEVAPLRDKLYADMIGAAMALDRVVTEHNK